MVMEMTMATNDAERSAEERGRRMATPATTGSEKSVANSAVINSEGSVETSIHGKENERPLGSRSHEPGSQRRKAFGDSCFFPQSELCQFISSTFSCSEAEMNLGGRV